jgi:epoxyqueuosine reductase
VSKDPIITADGLAGLLRRLCPEARIDLAGAVVLPQPLPHAQQWRQWVDAGLHAGLEYLFRDPDDRADPTRRAPWARSLLVFAQRHADGWSAADRTPCEGAAAGRSWTDGVARYARGRDYHDVLLRDIRTVLAGLAGALPGLRAQPAVDTGPYLEREYAWLAGLGFFGRNTCLIHERLGSGLLLGVALANLRVDGLPPPGTAAAAPLYALVPRPDWGPRAAGAATHCGRCRACVEACPTGALDREFRLDANRCLSTWTIEWRGRPPAEERRRQGTLLFGCDICQAVCPWNRKAARAPAPVPPREEYALDAAHAEVELGDLVRLDAETFRRRFRATPIWRCHPEGLRRNALIVAANARRRDLLDGIRTVAARDPDQDVRAVARWAAVRLEEGP